MRALTVGLSWLVVLWMSNPSHADGLFYQLPPDGTWAKYEIEGRRVVGQKEERQGIGVLTVSSVGIRYRDGETYRWIELVNDYTSRLHGKENKSTDARKMLLREEFLTEGKDPLSGVLDAWNKRDDQKAVRQSVKFGAPAVQPMAPLLRSPADELTPLPESIIECKLGKLKCAGIRGTSPKFVYEARLNKRAPFGVVTYRHEEKEEEGRSFILLLKLIDTGQKAETRIPEGK
jgi:hypothetical protein